MVGWRRNRISNKNTLIEGAFNLIVMPLVSIAQWTNEKDDKWRTFEEFRESIEETGRAYQKGNRHLCQLDINRSKR